MNTNDLYKELRRAVLNRDDAQAVRVLRQIVAMDPADADAAQQLAEYEARMTSTSDVVSEGNAIDNKEDITHSLYRAFRRAIHRKNLKEAHSCLTQILEHAPDDENAREQIKEIGRQLVKSLEPDLQDVLDTGDVSAICRKVAEFRTYCQDEKVLSSLSAWAAAARIAEQIRMRELAAQLEEMFCELASIKNVKNAFEHAESISGFVSSESLELTSEQSEKLDAAREEWNHYLHEQELDARYEELINRYQDIKTQFNQSNQPLPCLAALDDCEKQLASLAAEKDVAAFAEKMRKYKKSVLRMHQAMVRSRRIKRIVAAFVLMFVLIIAGAAVFAHETIRTRHMALSSAYLQKDVVQVESLLNNNPSIVYISRRINSTYDALCDDCSKWLNVWRKDSRQLKDHIYWLQCNEENISQMNINERLDQFVRIKIFIDEYEQKYKLNNQQYYVPHLNMFESKLAEVSGMLFQRLTSLPDDSSLPGLYKEWTCYQQLKNIFTQEQAQEIEKAIVAAANQEMRKNVPSSLAAVNPQQLQKAKELYNQFKDSLKLDADINNKIAQLEESMGWIKNLPALLARCHTLKDYIAVLQQNPEAYQTLNGVNLSALEKMREQEEETLAAGKAYFYLLKHTKLEVSDPAHALRMMNNVKAVYFQRRSLYSGPRSGKVERAINNMTNYTSSMWTNRYKVIRHGNTVYVGTFSFINKECTQTLYEIDGTPVEEKKKLGYIHTRPENTILEGIPEQLNFDRINLLRGVILPANLMQNVAMYDNKFCPVLARAYLFGLAVEYLEALNDPILSGWAWSPSMRSDIKEFKKLAAETALKEGAWMQNHSMEDERKWENFLSKVRKNYYLDEIRKALRYELSPDLRFAGYVGATGEAEVNVSQHKSNTLYVMHEGELKPFIPRQFSPYLPLYTNS